MLDYLQNKLSTWRLQARYERLVHERLLKLTEESAPALADGDERDWQLTGSGLGATLPEPARRTARDRARHLVTHNPHARNMLRLLEAYVTGTGLKLIHLARDVSQAKSARTMQLVALADRLWLEFMTTNQTHYSFREHARRAWRDGEAFLRRFSDSEWPPAVRFVDPERIGPTGEEPDSEGIRTRSNDVELPVSYLLTEPEAGRLLEAIPAQEMLHTRLGVDSNQKRGLTIFLPVLDVLDAYDQWMKTELLARKLQSSIVLWRKVQGSPQQTGAFADGASSGAGRGGDRRERLQPGTILTTNQSTEIQFLQPQTNFGDAVPLGRMLLLATAAGAGLPEFMLTADASNANYASTMVAEGPAVKLFQCEQAFFAVEFSRLWRWVMSEAIHSRLLPHDFFEQVSIDWSFPQLVNRDRPRERLADVRLVESRVLSRAEVARRDGADPEKMRSELFGEMSDEMADDQVSVAPSLDDDASLSPGG